MEKHHIWEGVLQWSQPGRQSSERDEKNNDADAISEIKCQVFTKDKNGGPEVTAIGWPTNLVLQLMSTDVVREFGGSHFLENRTVLVSMEPSDPSTKLTTLMQSGQWVGFVEMREEEESETSCPIQLLLLVYSSFRHAYLGIIPNDQPAFVQRLKELVEEGMGLRAGSLEPGTSPPAHVSRSYTDQGGELQSVRVGRIDQLLQRLSNLSLEQTNAQTQTQSQKTQLTTS